jgi:hypothetical protein
MDSHRVWPNPGVDQSGLCLRFFKVDNRCDDLHHRQGIQPTVIEQVLAQRRFLARIGLAINQPEKYMVEKGSDPFLSLILHFLPDGFDQVPESC